MTATLAQLEEWLRGREHEHLEFKEARHNFHFEKLVKYCAALANEGGGTIVLGVTDRRPRHVVGTTAFADLERTKAGLVEKLRLRIDACELPHGGGRVLVFTAPSRPIGMPVPVEGAYWMRAGEDLVPMTPDVLQRIFAEAGPDFSAEICPEATVADLAPEAIDLLRGLWLRKSGNERLQGVAVEQLLTDAELLTDHGVTYAALILLGRHAALGRFLAQAELVFEYRSSNATGPANQRDEYRQGFLLYYDRLWATIALRNDLQHYQERFVMHQVPTFREASVREAILNAIAHRDYRHPGSVFLRQYARRLDLASPGGFPLGITPDNIIDKQYPRNRRIAETFLRCGLVERSGQGANRMLEECVRDSKPLPDYSRSDSHEVALTLHGDVQDPSFIRYLKALEAERTTPFSSHEYLVLDMVRRGVPIPKADRAVLQSLKSDGAIESQGRGRGTRYVLTRRIDDQAGGAHPLDRQALKELLRDYLRSRGADGSSLSELLLEFQPLTRDRAQSLLRELRAEGAVHSRGRTKSGRWYLGKEER